MKVTLALAAALLVQLAACDYTAPLTSSPQAAIDRDLVGVWQSTATEDENQTLLVLPLGQKEYLISFPAGQKDAMFARVCQCSCAGKTLAQIQWIGTAAGVVPDNDRVYQYASCALAGQELTIRLLNPDIVNKNVKTTEQLVRAIEAAKDHPALFREPMKFKRVKKGEDER
ncbi:MAG TPA: hypothetical protein P5137_17945 [Candidatus Brocadiia bacterium]|nr:hypothetical protein [Candidatus Brocadiia bacterium]